jgi:hypothetical protein
LKLAFESGCSAEISTEQPPRHSAQQKPLAGCGSVKSDVTVLF